MIYHDLIRIMVMASSSVTCLSSLLNQWLEKRTMHIYKERWSPYIDEEVYYQWESDNSIFLTLLLFCTSFF